VRKNGADSQNSSMKKYEQPKELKVKFKSHGN